MAIPWRIFVRHPSAPLLPHRRRPISRYFRTSAYFVSLLLASAVTRKYVVDWSTGDGPSMFPTLVSEKSVIIISRFHKHGRGVKVGDIIEAQSPLFYHQRVAKRVVGMPGDFVVLDPEISSTVGGAVLPEKATIPSARERHEPLLIEVPEGHVWLAGDNLGYSRDSRTYGPLPMALIKGKIIASADGVFTGWTWYGNQDQLTSQIDLDLNKARKEWHEERRFRVSSPSHVASRVKRWLMGEKKDTGGNGGTV